MMVEWIRKDPMNKYVSRTLFRKAKQYLLQLYQSLYFIC